MLGTTREGFNHKANEPANVSESSQIKSWFVSIINSFQGKTKSMNKETQQLSGSNCTAEVKAAPQGDWYDSTLHLLVEEILPDSPAAQD